MRISIFVFVLCCGGLAQASTCTGWINVQATEAFASKGNEAKNISINIPNDPNESATVTGDGQTVPYRRVSTTPKTIEITRVEEKETTTIRLTEKQDRSVDLSGEVVNRFGKIYDLSGVLSCKN